MPTYQYACTVCGEQLEAVQSFSDASLTTCPACGGTLRKVFSAVGVVFKGSGFYKTDSRKASTATDAPAKSSTSDGEKKGGGEKGGSEKTGNAPAAAKTESSTSSTTKPAAAASSST